MDALSFHGLGLGFTVLGWVVGDCAGRFRDRWPRAAARLHGSLSGMVRHEVGPAQCWCQDQCRTGRHEYSQRGRRMTKFRTACLIHPHSPKMADPPFLSVLAGARPIKSTSGVPIIRAYQDTAPWAAGTNCVRDLWGMAKGGR